MSNDIKYYDNQIIVYTVMPTGIIVEEPFDKNNMNAIYPELLKEKNKFSNFEEAKQYAKGVDQRNSLRRVQEMPSFNDFKQDSKISKALFKAMMEYLKTEGWKKKYNGFLIIGETGVGKTFALQCLATELIRKNFRVLFKNVTAIVDEVKETFNENASTTEFEVMKNYQRMDFLFIDDFGSERINEFSQNLIYRIIDYRYQMDLPTFISSNLTLAEIENAKEIGFKRIMSRIQDRCVTINITSKSRREKNVLMIKD